MDRWTVMALKIFMPSICFGLLALLLVFMAPDQTINPLIRPFAEMYLWLSLGAMLAALGFGIFSAYSLWRWQRGEALMCNCGGLLGRERPGIRGRTDYRTCLACGRHVSSKDYN